MTIPEYDTECDCDFCTTLRNERLNKMTPAPPHPKRCETCDNIDCEHYDMDSHDGEWYFTSLKGCASHITTQSEAH